MMLKRLYWKIRIRWLALRWVVKINLGDEVWYKHKKYTVANGVRCNSWRLIDLDNGDDGWVPRSECRKVRSIGNAFRSYRYGVSFYTGYWLDIWCRTGITDWMRGLDIWPRR